MSTKIKIGLAVLAALFVSNGVFAQSHSIHDGPLMNYHRIDERLVTGGHLVDDGLATLKAQGVQVVIDLRDDLPSGQKEKLAREGFDKFTQLAEL